jgi:hypothetical protein
VVPGGIRREIACLSSSRPIVMLAAVVLLNVFALAGVNSPQPGA